ncbi:hypothetical protein RYX36_027548 [Vicia faba]
MKVVSVQLPTFGKVCPKAQFEGGAPPPPSTFSSDVGFDTLCFKSSDLHFSKEFPSDYQSLKSKLNHVIISMNANFMLRTFMVEDVDQKRRNKVEREI